MTELATKRQSMLKKNYILKKGSLKVEYICNFIEKGTYFYLLLISIYYMHLFCIIYAHVCRRHVPRHCWPASLDCLFQDRRKWGVRARWDLPQIVAGIKAKSPVFLVRHLSF